MNLIEQLESRLPRTASDNSRHNLRSAVMIAQGHAKRASEIRSDAHLSDEGKREKLAELKAATSTNGHLVQIRTQAQKKLDDIRAERDSFKAAALKRPVDPLAEMRAAEIRTMLRGLPDSERLRLALGDDPEIRDAVALAPAVLSGVPATIHEQLVDRIVSARFQTRSAELASIEDEAEAVAAAVQVATDMIARG
jgi:hypothetical protein